MEDPALSIKELKELLKRNKRKYMVVPEILPPDGPGNTPVAAIRSREEVENYIASCWN